MSRIAADFSLVQRLQAIFFNTSLAIDAVSEPLPYSYGVTCPSKKFNELLLYRNTRDIKGQVSLQASKTGQDALHTRALRFDTSGVIYPCIRAFACSITLLDHAQKCDVCILRHIIVYAHLHKKTHHATIP